MHHHLRAYPIFEDPLYHHSSSAFAGKSEVKLKASTFNAALGGVWHEASANEELSVGDICIRSGLLARFTPPMCQAGIATTPACEDVGLATTQA
eukprot:1670904-Amphidinium_carterae.1